MLKSQQTPHWELLLSYFGCKTGLGTNFGEAESSEALNEMEWTSELGQCEPASKTGCDFEGINLGGLDFEGNMGGFESDIIAVGEEEDDSSQLITFLLEDGPKLKALLSEDSLSEDDDDQADNDIESINTSQKRKAEVSKEIEAQTFW